jgi:two-component system response regulator TtrR
VSAVAGLVYVVDDDEAVRDSLRMLFASAGLRVETFGSGREFIDRARPGADCCLVLDIRMPGMTGSALQDDLLQRGVRVPIVFITGHGDIPMAVEAVKKGAFDFIEKPFDGEQLLSQVQRALELPGAGALGALSERERQVLDLVLAGKPSRQIAVELFISVKTVDFHRARIMAKLGVRSVAQLFRVCLTH